MPGSSESHGQLDMSFMSRYDANLRTNETAADHDSYCSAPPLALPPRPSRAEEARRPRAPIWTGKCEVSASEAETEYAINDTLDVKPDVKSGSLIVIMGACSIQPETPSAASSPDAQRVPIPNVMVRMGTITYKPAPPPVRPRNATKGMKVQAASAATAAVPAAELRAAPAAAASANPPRRPGRPLGSKNKPRVEGTGTSTPLPMRRAAKSAVRMTRESLSRQ